MNKPWLGLVASAFILLSGVLEWWAGNKKLAIFLVVMSLLSYFLRRYFLKKIGNNNDQH